MGRAKLSEVYKPEYADMLVEHMSCGHSFSSFAAVINCSIRRIDHWCNKVDSFSHAREVGEVHALLFWEKAGIRGLETKVFNATIWQFWMRNKFRKFGWKDKFADDEKDGVLVQTGPSITISNDQVQDLIKMAKSELNPIPKTIEPKPDTIIEPEMLHVPEGELAENKA